MIIPTGATKLENSKSSNHGCKISYNSHVTVITVLTVLAWYAWHCRNGWLDSYQPLLVQYAKSLTDKASQNRAIKTAMPLIPNKASMRA